jgi:hypothetical protein
MHTTSMDSAEPYDPQPGYHSFAAGPPWCDHEGDPLEPGWCAGTAGEVQAPSRGS